MAAAIEKTVILILTMSCLSFVQDTTFGSAPDVCELEELEYRQELMRIKAVRNSFTPGQTNDLESYEKFADEIQNKWKHANREYYARLMLKICSPLSSGTFKSNRRYEVARRYALSVLGEPNSTDPNHKGPEALSIDLELNLIRHVVTLTDIKNAPKSEDFARLRNEDVEIRLHTWKRLTDAIDPNWDPNDLPRSNVCPPPGTGNPCGVAPEAIKDPNLRAEYEKAIERNRQKAEKYGEQYGLRQWLRSFPKRAEKYIILAYSREPHDLAELESYLNKYLSDEKTKTRIIAAVRENMKMPVSD